MKKEESKAFEMLFKVETLRNLIKITKSGKVSMPIISMHDRCLKFMEYGFEEGIKYAQQKQ